MKTMKLEEEISSLKCWSIANQTSKPSESSALLMVDVPSKLVCVCHPGTESHCRWSWSGWSSTFVGGYDGLVNGWDGEWMNGRIEKTSSPTRKMAKGKKRQRVQVDEKRFLPRDVKWDESSFYKFIVLWINRHRCQDKNQIDSCSNPLLVTFTTMV